MLLVHFGNDFMLAFVQDLLIINFIEVLQIDFILVFNGVVDEAVTGSKLLRDRWWLIVNFRLIVILLITRSVKQVLDLFVLFGRRIHASLVRYVGTPMEYPLSFDHVHNLLVHSVENAALVCNCLVVTVFNQWMILVGDFLLLYLSFERTDARVVPLLFGHHVCILIVRVHGLFVQFGALVQEKRMSASATNTCYGLANY